MIERELYLLALAATAIHPHPNTPTIGFTVVLWPCGTVGFSHSVSSVAKKPGARQWKPLYHLVVGIIFRHRPTKHIFNIRKNKDILS